MLDKSQKENYTALTKMAAAKSSVAFIFISLPDISRAENTKGERLQKLGRRLLRSIIFCPTYRLTLEDFRDFAIREQSFYEEIRRIVMYSPTAPEITF